MAISLFEFYKIGIGPSSSHTVGPMRAAKQFGDALQEMLPYVDRIAVELYGSLALTGEGHGTDKAIALGLMGFLPENVDPERVPLIMENLEATQRLLFLGTREIAFDLKNDLIWHKHQFLPYHSNAMRFHALDKHGKELLATLFYSVGGGFIVTHEEAMREQTAPLHLDVPYPFTTGRELLDYCQREKLSIAEIMLANELCMRSKEEIEEGILKIWSAMEDSVRRGLNRTEPLPGPLKMKRRAPDLHRKLLAADSHSPTYVMDWTALFALAVSEENGAGGKIVTAPTNGAAGVIPAVLHYAQKFLSHFSEEKVIEFFLTTGAIVSLYKQGASLSAAEMGCQGEIGVASSMAAAGLCAINGGTPQQVEHAAEIAMEHHLGLTCDPVAGLVQIPCIERNTMGATKAILAASLALSGGTHYVQLDDVIRTMYEVGKNMPSEYKETSEGGLAKHVRLGVTVC